MRNQVKKFIQKYADLIENEDWQALFRHLIMTDCIYHNDNLVESLLYIFDVAGINYHDYFNKYRKLPGEDIAQIINFLRNIWSNIYASNIGGTIISDFAGNNEKDIQLIIDIARDFNLFKFYKEHSNIHILADWRDIQDYASNSALNDFILME